jgi:hypothetical protein
MLTSRLRQTGNASVVLVLGVVLISAVGFWLFWKTVSSKMESIQTQGLPQPNAGTAAFVEAWSRDVFPAAIYDMALTPGHTGEFFALDYDRIYRFDQSGVQRDKFAAPSKSSRLFTDPTGRVPYLLVVSRKTKWTGAIDYVLTTDEFLHALDTRGREVWNKRLDPKEVSALEAVPATLSGTAVILLSTGRRILCFDVNGRQVWETRLWHHPGTLAAVDLDGDGTADILAAQSPQLEIVRIDARGQIVGPWAKGEGPSRLRTEPMDDRGRVSAVTLRQIFGRQAGGVQHALAFLDESGTVLGEVELPPRASPLSYSPLAAIDVDGNRRKSWVIALGDGSIHVFSPRGEHRAQQFTGKRLLTFLVVPQERGPDLLVTATSRGLTAWRPVPARMTPPI